MTFEHVLERGRARDADALSLLYRRFLPVVYRFLLARVSDVPLAEDLTSETFFAVMGGIADVRATDELGFATWVLGIARNKLSQHFRRLKGRREIPMTLAETDEPPTTAEEDDPLLVITARESWAEVVAALNLLTPEQRMVLLHRCVLGRSTEDVARMMGKPANAIYGLQFRALASLARHLEKIGPPGRAPTEMDRRRGATGGTSERRRGHAAGREA
jgi:RNA polymerase sigma-70 factor (ECF subfamily)